MTNTQPVNGSSLITKYQLGKKPNLTEKQIKIMRMVLQSFTVTQPQIKTYHYNIASKQSNWGLSQNQRLLILNVQQKSISYFSKVPQGYLPFTSFQQIDATKVKQKVHCDQVSNFKCLPVKGRISSMTIQWTDKDKSEKKWLFILGSSKHMNDWVDLINSVKDGNYNRKKYQQMDRMNNNIPPESNLVSTINPGNMKNINNSSISQPLHKPDASQVDNQNNENIRNHQDNQNIVPSDSRITKQSILPKQQNDTKPLLLDGGKKLSSSNLHNSNLQNSQAQKIRGANLGSSNLVSQGSGDQDNIIYGQPQVSRKPKIAKLGQPELRRPVDQAQNGRNQPSRVMGQDNIGYSDQKVSQEAPSILPQQKNLGYSNVNHLSSSKLSNLNKDPSNSNIRNLAQRNLSASNLNKNPSNSNVRNPGQKNLSVNNLNNVGVNKNSNNTTQGYNVNNIGYPSNPNQYNLASSSGTSQILTQNVSLPSKLNPSESKSPADFVQQLKRQKQKNPNKFNLSNQLSQKNFQDYNPQVQAQYQNPVYQQQNYGLSNAKKNEQVMSRKPSSRQIFNRQNSDQRTSKLQYQPEEEVSAKQQLKPFSRNKTNKSQLNKNQQGTNRQPSRPRLGSNQLGASSSGVQNNYDDQQQVDHYDNDDQIYKPASNFPQSTKNLSKIRSDYLQKKAHHLGYLQEQAGRPYPQTSKNQTRLLKDNYLQGQKDHYMQGQKENYMQRQKDKYMQGQKVKANNYDNQKPSRQESSQRRRQQSTRNLPKLNPSDISHHSVSSSPSYNQLWLQTSNPNKKIQIHEQFINRSRQLVKQIIKQLPLPKSHRQFQPVHTYQQENLYIFTIQNLVITLHFFGQQQSINGSDDNIDMNAPVMYDHTTFEQIKRQFYNYNLVLSVTNNQGKIKVPLCCYLQYRGVLAVVKADVPQKYKQVEPYQYKEKFQDIQNMIKVRFLFNTFNCYESQDYRGGEGKFILVWNLKNLIPGIPNNLKNQSTYFRKQLLLQYDQILQDLQSSSEAHAFTLGHVMPDLLSKLQSLQIQIIHSKDLLKEFHRAGLSLSYLPQMYQKTTSTYLKKIFMSEIVAGIFTSVVRSQLNHAFFILPAQNLHNISTEQLDNVIVDCAYVLINQFFSYTLRSQSIWKLIVSEASKRYHMIVSKQGVIAGYLLSALIDKINLSCDFKLKTFLKNKKFFVHENIIPRQAFQKFRVKVRRYDMQSICPTYSKCKQLMEVQQLGTQSYEQICVILNLKARTNGFQEYFEPLAQQLKTSLASFIPYTLEQEYQHLDVYEHMYEQPISYNGVKTSFLAVKWLIKANEIEKANQIFQIKFHELSYWLGQYNTAITEFYDFFSMYYASIGDFDESICLAKSSLINVGKLLGQHALAVADKHYQLGNIYFKIDKKNQALKQYNKTKLILVKHEKTNIPEYGIILLKLSLLCLNFGQLAECLTNAIQAERIFQSNGGNENEQIQCFQVLARVYQITRKQSDMMNLCQACSKTFNLTENPKILERMLKIILYPKLSSLSSQQQKSLLPLLLRLYEHTSSSSMYLQSFNFLHKLAFKTSIKKKIYYYFENVTILAEEINRRDLLRKHSSLNEKSNGEAEGMLIVLEAVGNIVGWGFMIGALKEGSYQ